MPGTLNPAMPALTLSEIRARYKAEMTHLTAGLKPKKCVRLAISDCDITDVPGGETGI